MTKVRREIINIVIDNYYDAINKVKKLEMKGYTASVTTKYWNNPSSYIVSAYKTVRR